jgi:hypothetical protein
MCLEDPISGSQPLAVHFNGKSLNREMEVRQTDGPTHTHNLSLTHTLQVGKLKPYVVHAIEQAAKGARTVQEGAGTRFGCMRVWDGEDHQSCVPFGKLCGRLLQSDFLHSSTDR